MAIFYYNHDMMMYFHQEGDHSINIEMMLYLIYIKTIIIQKNQKYDLIKNI